MESPTQTIRVEQSQSDRSKKPFHPVRYALGAWRGGHDMGVSITATWGGGGGHDIGVQISVTVNLVSIVELLHDFQGFSWSNIVFYLIFRS